MEIGTGSIADAFDRITDLFLNGFIQPARHREHGELECHAGQCVRRQSPARSPMAHKDMAVQVDTLTRKSIRPLHPSFSRPACCPWTRSAAPLQSQLLRISKTPSPPPNSEQSQYLIWNIELIGKGENSTIRAMRLLFPPQSAVQYIMGCILPTPDIESTTPATRLDRMLRGRIDDFGCMLEQSCYEILDRDGAGVSLLYAELIYLLAVLKGKTEYGLGQRSCSDMPLSSPSPRTRRSASPLCRFKATRAVVTLSSLSYSMRRRRRVREPAGQILTAPQTGVCRATTDMARNGTELHVTIVTGSGTDDSAYAQRVGDPTEIVNQRVVSDESDSTKSGSTYSDGGQDADTGTASMTLTPSPVKGNSDTGAGEETAQGHYVQRAGCRGGAVFVWRLLLTLSIQDTCACIVALPIDDTGYSSLASVTHDRDLGDLNNHGDRRRMWLQVLIDRHETGYHRSYHAFPQQQGSRPKRQPTPHASRTAVAEIAPSRRGTCPGITSGQQRRDESVPESSRRYFVAAFSRRPVKDGACGCGIIRACKTARS
ncbi:hypothetical protein CONLIGDRAFT_649854 [Coniochaeta ligniaria NRRL 30616]|uniref:Uncharacterized protein n=1 Tax=Coniochaeta ligniaria NRRL 30616 TaxID=1408157 RepID=A0A1J7I7K0_9PEZI|nr:hypothetical protein CONLIGDRAFT_649854 [Coniochaeta ligniaria NRRL 30616]